jgi:hypothetical protein
LWYGPVYAQRLPHSVPQAQEGKIKSYGVFPGSFSVSVICYERELYLVVGLGTAFDLGLRRRGLAIGTLKGERDIIEVVQVAELD